MREKLELLVHLICTLLIVLKPGGVKALVAENHAMKQQLLVLNRGRKRSPSLTSSDRFLFGFLAIFISEKRIRNLAVILKPSTILRFHKALVNRKYSELYSNKVKLKPGQKPRDQALIATQSTTWGRPSRH